MITRFTDESVKRVRAEIESALQEIGKRNGLKISSLGAISYSGKNLTTGKITIALESSQEPVYGVDLASLVGKQYKTGSRVFTILKVEDGKLLARTNRGALYTITRQRLAEMVQI